MLVDTYRKIRRTLSCLLRSKTRTTTGTEIGKHQRPASTLTKNGSATQNRFSWFLELTSKSQSNQCVAVCTQQPKDWATKLKRKQSSTKAKMQSQSLSSKSQDKKNQKTNRQRVSEAEFRRRRHEISLLARGLAEVGCKPLIRDYLNDPNVFIGLIIFDGDLVGVHVTEWEHLPLTTNLIIHFLYVKPDYRRLGIASAWIQERIDYCGELNAEDSIYHKIVVSVHETEDAAQLFLKHNGFRCVSIDHYLERYIFIHPHEDSDQKCSMPCD